MDKNTLYELFSLFMEEDLDSLYINLVKVDTHTQRKGGGGEPEFFPRGQNMVFSVAVRSFLVQYLRQL